MIYDPNVLIVTGRCSNCGDSLDYGEEGWNGEDNTPHFPYFDKGGGNIERLECGPVWRE